MSIRGITRTFAIVAFLVATSMYSQNDSISKEDEAKFKESMQMMFTSEIKMDIDKEIYKVSQGNSHFTEDQKSGIMAMMAPASIEKLKSDLDKDKPKEGFELLDKGEFEFEGKKMLYSKQKVVKEGEEYIILMYGKENDENSSIMVTAFYEASKDDIYPNHVKNAAKSAQLIKE